METTKKVSEVILRDNVLKDVIHEELYQTFRKTLNTKYEAIKKAYFNQKWIKSLCS